MIIFTVNNSTVATFTGREQPTNINDVEILIKYGMRNVLSIFGRIIICGFKYRKRHRSWNS